MFLFCFEVISTRLLVKKWKFVMRALLFFFFEPSPPQDRTDGSRPELGPYRNRLSKKFVSFTIHYSERYKNYSGSTCRMEYTLQRIITSSLHQVADIDKKQ